MFSVLLELPEFEVTKQEIFDSHYLIHVEKTETKERCLFCGFHSSNIHDRRTKKVRDLSIMNKPLYLIVTVKRYYCENCGEVFSSPFESIELHQRYTNRFREFVYEQVLHSTVQDASQKLQIPYSTVERMFYSVAKEKVAEHVEWMEEIQSEKQGITLSMDEIAVRKGHKYETVVYDADLGAVIGMHQDRDYHSTLELLTSMDFDPNKVKNVVLDMWDPFHKAIHQAFPDAQIIVDKYHVVQKVVQALDQIRKQIPGLKKARFHLLRSYENLQEKNKPRLEEILDTHEELRHGYFLKELFRDIYKATDYESANKRLAEWLQLALESPFKPFHQVAKTIKKWREPILQYFKTPYTNGKAEGTNHKIKNIKRRAYGYRNPERFRLRVFLECTGQTYKEAAS